MKRSKITITEGHGVYIPPDAEIKNLRTTGFEPIRKSMTEPELYDALDGLFAYDSGAVSSGIHDELLRQRVKDYLKGLPDKERAVVLARYVREQFLTEERLEQQYCLEDVQSFLVWIDEVMDIWIGY